MEPEELEPIKNSTKGGIPMIAVGIDVSKSKSTVAILNSDGTTLVKPYTMLPLKRICVPWLTIYGPLMNPSQFSWSTQVTTIILY